MPKKPVQKTAIKSDLEKKLEQALECLREIRDTGSSWVHCLKLAGRAVQKIEGVED
jgi:hypothetical protein